MAGIVKVVFTTSTFVIIWVIIVLLPIRMAVLFRVLSVTNKLTKGGSFSFVENGNGGGDFYMGNMMNDAIDNLAKVESVAHELFHGFLHENGQGGASIANELEANLFGKAVGLNWQISTDNWVGGSAMHTKKLSILY